MSARGDYQARLLAAGLGLDVVGDEVDHVVPDDVIALALRGRRSDAVRVLRAAHPALKLLAAKKIVDAAASTPPPPD